MPNSLPNDEVIIVSMNPCSGAADRRAQVQQLVQELEGLGFEVFLLTDIDEVVAIAEQHFGNRLRCVVAAGGDGTVALLVNRLPDNTPLTVFPLGTENLLAKHFKIPLNVKTTVQMIQAGNCQQIDLGRANGKLFLVMASCGFDADVVQRLHGQRKGHIRHWSYVKPIWRAMQRYKYPKIQITLKDQNGVEIIRYSRWTFVFNVPRYAMGLPIMPDADPSDSFLDLCTFRRGSLLRGLFYLFAVLCGRHRQWTSSETFQFRKATFESDSEVPFQIDGDPGGTLPLEIQVVPAGVTLIVP